MAYILVFEVIEATKSWTCPATGYYLITAGAGGGGAGGATSFGTYLTAAGIGVAGGSGGYTLDGVYGGVGAYLTPGNPGITVNPTKNGGSSGQAGSGYGAGNPMQPSGKLLAKIIQVSAGTVIPCTIGIASNASNNGVIVIKSA